MYACEFVFLYISFFIHFSTLTGRKSLIWTVFLPCICEDRNIKSDKTKYCWCALWGYEEKSHTHTDIKYTYIVRIVEHRAPTAYSIHKYVEFLTVLMNAPLWGRLLKTHIFNLGYHQIIMFPLRFYSALSNQLSVCVNAMGHTHRITFHENDIVEVRSKRILFILYISFWLCLKLQALLVYAALFWRSKYMDRGVWYGCTDWNWMGVGREGTKLLLLLSIPSCTTIWI